MTGTVRRRRTRGRNARTSSTSSARSCPESKSARCRTSGKFGQHVRDKDRFDELTDDRRAVWEPRRDRAWPSTSRRGWTSSHRTCDGCRRSAPGSTTSTTPASPTPSWSRTRWVSRRCPIAEFVIARLLSVWKRFADLDALQREHTWRATFGRLFDTSTVGLVGLGAIGGAVARSRARARRAHVGHPSQLPAGRHRHRSPTSCSAPTRSTRSWRVATRWC